MNQKNKKMLKENLLAIVVFYAIVSTPMYIYALVMQDDIIADREWETKAIRTAFKIQSETFKRVSLDNKMLRQANECLIKYSNRDRCITAIKHTPLPPMVKDMK